jgi:hypothetical protein
VAALDAIDVPTSAGGLLGSGIAAFDLRSASAGRAFNIAMNRPQDVLQRRFAGGAVGVVQVLHPMDGSRLPTSLALDERVFHRRFAFDALRPDEQRACRAAGGV